MTFHSLKKRDNGQYELQLTLYRDNKDPQVFQAFFNVSPNLKLSTPGGDTYQYYSSNSSGDGDKINRTFIFNRRGGGRGDSAAKAPEPNKLVIQVPSATQEVNIPFELVDLPMP